MFVIYHVYYGPGSLYSVGMQPYTSRIDEYASHLTFNCFFNKSIITK